MARQRVIQPEIWVDPGFMALHDAARLLWIGMISFADDEGRGIGNAKSLKALIFPGDSKTIAQIEKLKVEVAKNVRVTFYEVDGQTYYQIEKWREYQKINHPSPSKIPPRVNITGSLQERSVSDFTTSEKRSPQLINQLTNKLNNGDSLNDPVTARPSKMRPADLDHLKAGEKIKTMFQGIKIQEAL